MSAPIPNPSPVELALEGWRFRIRDIGPEEDRAPIVLLHCVGLDHRVWGPVQDMLARVSDRRSMAVDLRGHGVADPATRLESLDTAAEDVVRLIDRLRLGRVTVVGLSMGGLIAQIIARRFPDRLCGLGLIGASPGGQPAHAERGRAALGPAGMAGVLDTTFARWFTPAQIAADGWAVRYVRHLVETAEPARWAAAWEALSCARGYGDAPPPAGVPVFAVAGELDAATPPALMEQAFSHLCGGPPEVIGGATHMLPMTHPAEVADAIDRHAPRG